MSALTANPVRVGQDKGLLSQRPRRNAKATRPTNPLRRTFSVFSARRAESVSSVTKVYGQACAVVEVGVGAEASVVRVRACGDGALAVALARAF